MNLLLDTHALLWSLFSDEKLSKNARTAITSNQNTVFVSPVSFWEISLKYSLQKISLPDVLPEELPDAAIDSGMEILPIYTSDMTSFYRLPNTGNKDPFDRMIISQAI